VFGLKRQVEPLHLVHYLALASCLEVVAPDELHIHCHELPFGFYWDLIRPRVQLHRVEPVEQIASHSYRDASGHYAYAHHADFIRLDVLERWGGLYADIDTLFLRAPGEECWSAPAVIGREADVLDSSGRSHGSLSNALLMSAPGGEFVRVWRERIAAAFDGSWSAHSCLLAYDLAQELPGSVRVEPRRAFHAFEPTPEGLRRLLVDPPCSLDGVSCVHLMAHLWWRRGRRDFIDLHAEVITERWIREADTTYALAARRFLPDHGVF
jgi:hypothetical protein